ILSAEIIAITLGTVATASFATQATVVSVIAIVMTVGVYGFVACVVKLDDAGLYLSQRASAVPAALGRGILIVAPYLMKGLSVVGTIAMFLVGGGILAHGLPGFEAWLHNLLPSAGSWPGPIASVLAVAGPTLANAM